RILRWIPHRPGHVRLDERDHETERLISFARHELANALQIMSERRLAHAVLIETGNPLERKRLRRLDVRLSGEADTIAELAEIVRQAPHVAAACGVIPGAAVPHRIEPRVELGTTRLAHRRADVRALEDEPGAREAVDMRSLRVPAAVE